MERQLVTIRTVSEVLPIENADYVELAKIDGWQCVVGKGDFKPGDPCVYFEIDSFIPVDRPWSAFLRNRCIKWRDQEGARIKTMKLRGYLSQGLALPYSAFGNEIRDYIEDQVSSFPLSDENTISLADRLGVVHWYPPEPTDSFFGGNRAGNFPNFVRKTDQERLQNLFNIVYPSEDMWEVTEKVDGTSCTMYMFEGKFGVCSRNYEVKDDEKNVYWKMAKKYEVEKRLRDIWQYWAIQGEIVGPGVQKNRLKLDDLEFMVYDIWDIEHQQYIEPLARHAICEALGLLHVPILEYRKVAFNTIEEALKYAEGRTVVLDNVRDWYYGDKNVTKERSMREGVVFKNSERPELSFKIINNQYLLKYGE